MEKEFEEIKGDIEDLNTMMTELNDLVDKNEAKLEPNKEIKPL